MMLRVLNLFMSVIFGATVLSVYGATEFDGQWSARAYTHSGDCNRQYTFILTVNQGQISGKVNSQQGMHTLEGFVNNDGTTEIGLIGPDEGTFSGTFTGDKAKGDWITKSCSGSFKLKRKS